MQKHTAAALAVLLLVVSITAGSASAATGETTDTVIVVVGDSPSHLLAGIAIADKKSASVVRVPASGLTPQVRDVIRGRMNGGDLRQAIVVGPQTDEVANQLENLTVSENGVILQLRVVDQVTGSAGSEILQQATVQTWTENSTRTGFVVASPSKRVALALTNDSVRGPVLSANMSAPEIAGTFDYLGIETIYVSPAVRDSLKQELNDSFVVSTAPAGVPLNQSVVEVANAYTEYTDRILVTSDDRVLSASAAAVRENTSVLVAASQSNLGSATADELRSHNASVVTYGYGSNVPIDEIQSAAPGRAVHFSAYPMLRGNLLAGNYQEGLLVRNVTKTGLRSYDVEVTNIGFKTIPKKAGWTAKLWWTGDDISTSPLGYTKSGRHYVKITDPLTPSETVRVRLEATTVSNGAYPHTKYRFQSNDGLVYLTGGTTGLPLLNNGVPDWVAALVALALTGGVVWFVLRDSSSQAQQQNLEVTLALVTLWLAVEVGLILLPFDSILGDLLWPVFTGIAWLGRSWVRDTIPLL